MAAPQTLQATVVDPARGSTPAAAGTDPGRALVTVPPPLEEDEAARFSGPVARLPVELDISVPVREFRVRDLLALEPGRLIESRWGHGNDVPLAAGDVQLAQCEFEVVETWMAVRITRLA